MKKNKSHAVDEKEKVDPLGNGTAEEKEKKDNDCEEYNGSERRGGDRRKSSRRKSDHDKLMIQKEELDSNEKEISRLNSDLESLKESMLRRQADFENFKKRVFKQQNESKKLAIKDFALDIIMINDDLLRAIEASSNIDGSSMEESHRSFVEGVTMVSSRIEDTLNRYGIVEVDSLNMEFDPNFNEAVEIEMSPDVEFDTVTKIYQKGFRLDDLVVRSAKVKVAKPLSRDDRAGDGETDSGDENGNGPEMDDGQG